MECENVLGNTSLFWRFRGYYTEFGTLFTTIIQYYIGALLPPSYFNTAKFYFVWPFPAPSPTLLALSFLSSLQSC